MATGARSTTPTANRAGSGPSGTTMATGARSTTPTANTTFISGWIRSTPKPWSTPIVRALSDIDTANAPRYRANGAALHRRLEALDETLMRALAPLRQRPYIVFHDAYRYFETRYGLTPAGSVTLGPERAPGAATLTALRRAIVEAGAVCVFAEPQFEPAILRMLVADTGARSGVLDPLGAGLEAGADAYFALLSGLAASLRQCLEPAGPTPSEPLE